MRSRKTWRQVRKHYMDLWHTQQNKDSVRMAQMVSHLKQQPGFSMLTPDVALENNDLLLISPDRYRIVHVRCYLNDNFQVFRAPEGTKVSTLEIAVVTPEDLPMAVLQRIAN